jgi:hypothetical protein
MRNGLVTPKTEGFAKQTQVMLLGGLCAEDMTAGSPPVSIKLEPLLSRFVWGKMSRKYSRIPYNLDVGSRSRNHAVNSQSTVCSKFYPIRNRI